MAQAHQNNGQHAHKGDRAAVRQLVNGKVAEHGAKRNHQCAFHKGACSCVCFCRHGKYPFQNGVTQKPKTCAVWHKNHTAHAELCCFMQKLPTPALPGSGKKGLWPRVRQPNLSLSAPLFLCPFPIIRAVRFLSRAKCCPPTIWAGLRSRAAYRQMPSSHSAQNTAPQAASATGRSPAPR